MAANSLISLAADLLSGRIRVVDLTQTLAPEFPQIVLPPEFGQCWPFRIEEISRYDERGPAWYWNNFSCGEHTGTHFDAPIHWVSGRDLPNNATHTCRCEHLLGAACVIDCSARGARGSRFPADRRSCAALGSSARPDPAARLGADAHRLVEARRSGRLSKLRRHRPAHARPAADAVRFLIEERDVLGFGIRSRSVPMPARATTSSRCIRATTTCTAQAATGCSA